MSTALYMFGYPSNDYYGVYSSIRPMTLYHPSKRRVEDDRAFDQAGLDCKP
jgi:hypothetical protein